MVCQWNRFVNFDKAYCTVLSSCGFVTSHDKTDQFSSDHCRSAADATNKQIKIQDCGVQPTWSRTAATPSSMQKGKECSFCARLWPGLRETSPAGSYHCGTQLRETPPGWIVSVTGLPEPRLLPSFHRRRGTSANPLPRKERSIRKVDPSNNAILP